MVKREGQVAKVRRTDQGSDQGRNEVAHQRLNHSLESGPDHHGHREIDDLPRKRNFCRSPSTAYLPAAPPPGEDRARGVRLWCAR